MHRTGLTLLTNWVVIGFIHVAWNSRSIAQGLIVQLRAYSAGRVNICLMILRVVEQARI